MSVYDQHSSYYFYLILACMSSVVFDTNIMEITNPKTWPRPRKLG